MSENIKRPSVSGPKAIRKVKVALKMFFSEKKLAEQLNIMDAHIQRLNFMHTQLNRYNSELRHKNNRLADCESIRQVQDNSQMRQCLEQIRESIVIGNRETQAGILVVQQQLGMIFKQSATIRGIKEPRSSNDCKPDDVPNIVGCRE